MRGEWRALLIVLAAGMTFCTLQAQDAPLERPRVEGTVVDRQDRPVAGADVYWSLVDGYLESRDQTVHALTDEHGRFQLEAPAEFRVPADTDRIGRLWVVGKEHALEVVPANDYRLRAPQVREGIVKLAAPAPFKLRVLDPARRAREGELVEPLHMIIREPARQPGVDRLQTGVPRLVRDRLAGITDGNGEYQVGFLQPGGRMGFRIVSETFGIQEEMGAEERGVVPVVTFQLRPTARIEGTTPGENRQAFAGMKLSISAFDPLVAEGNPAEVTRVGFRATVTVGEDGRFVVPAIGPGILQVTHDRRGRLDAPLVTAPFDIAAGTTASVTLAPEPTTVFRGVVVTEGTRTPVENALVSLSGGKGRIRAQAVTNARGEYSLTSYATDSVLQATIGVVHSRDVVEVKSSPGLNEVTCPPIRLPPTLRISGRVVDSNGDPVADAEVVGLEVAVHHGMATTSKDGHFEMLTAAERKITDFIVRTQGESRPVSIRSREPLELVLAEPGNSQ